MSNYIDVCKDNFIQHECSRLNKVIYRRGIPILIDRCQVQECCGAEIVSQTTKNLSHYSQIHVVSIVNILVTPFTAPFFLTLS